MEDGDDPAGFWRPLLGLNFEHEGFPPLRWGVPRTQDLLALGVGTAVADRQVLDCEAGKAHVIEVSVEVQNLQGGTGRSASQESTPVYLA
jgi:hypothetical protein